MDKLVLFNYEQGNLLIRLLIAHIAADFVLQTGKMVSGKRWWSAGMLQHTGIVYLCTAILSGWWVSAGIITVLHYITDGLKQECGRRGHWRPLSLFITDQLIHVAVIVTVWALQLGLVPELMQAIALPFVHYRYSLVLLGYLLVIFPAGYIIAYMTQHMHKPDASSTANGGKKIGIFERVIILTLVLLGQYEAIGFLITGKSIIRFANKDEHVQSEYVLVGTMISYAFSMLTGVLINWLIR